MDAGSDGRLRQAAEPMSDAPFSQWLLWGQVVAVVTAIDGFVVPPYWSVIFAMRDADTIGEHAVALGGTIAMAPADTPGFRSAVIADPQGRVIAVSAPHAEPNGAGRVFYRRCRRSK
jgi:hypothetical protein